MIQSLDYKKILRLRNVDPWDYHPAVMDLKIVYWIINLSGSNRMKECHFRRTILNGPIVILCERTRDYTRKLNDLFREFGSAGVRTDPLVTHLVGIQIEI